MTSAELRKKHKVVTKIRAGSSKGLQTVWIEYRTHSGLKKSFQTSGHRTMRGCLVEASEKLLTLELGYF